MATATTGILGLGLALKMGNGSSPQTFTTLAQANDVSGFGQEAPLVDVTHYQSTNREYIQGIPDGKQFTARQRIPTDGVPRHPQMIVGPTGELIVAWDEQGKGTRRVALARGSIDGNGVARFVKLPIGDSTRAEYPVLASVGDTTLVAWTSGSVGQTVLRVERLVN